MRQHRKPKDTATIQKLEQIAMSAPRRLMPRPTVFRDKTKYNRQVMKRIPLY